MKVTKTSAFTGKVHTLEIPCDQGQLDEYMSPVRARSVQEIFPNLTADQREFLMTGVTAQEWADAFGEEN